MTRHTQPLTVDGLYQADPNDFDEFKDKPHWEQYWCRNWTFTVAKRPNGKFIMCDTYFGDKCIVLTEENHNKFKLIFKFSEVKEVSKKIIADYDEQDYYHVATDSGGMPCGGKYYLKKDAKISKNKKMTRLKNEMEKLYQDYEYAKDEYLRYIEEISNEQTRINRNL